MINKCFQVFIEHAIFLSQNLLEYECFLPCIASRLHLLIRNAHKVINFFEKFIALAYGKSSTLIVKGFI